MSTGNDNHGPNRPLNAEPDAHGQAAFLMVESLILMLRDKGVLSTHEAIEVVETAAEVKREVAENWGDSPETLRRSLALIGTVITSLRADTLP